MNIAVVVAAALLVFSVVTYVAVVSTNDGLDEEGDAAASSARPSFSVVGLGQQAVKLLTNHFSLFAVLVNTTIATTMSSELMATFEAQQKATSPSPTQNTFASCLLPSLTVNDAFVGVVLLVSLLVFAEILIVRVVRHKWAVASVSAAVLQLTYLEVVGSASQLLHHVPMKFYNSTNYLSDGTSSSAVLTHLTLDVLGADVRIDFRTNTAHYVGAWLVLVGFGCGVPLWFAGSFKLLERKYSTDVARRKLKFLVDNYKTTQWYWESVVAARKGISVALIAALASFPVLQLQSIMLLFALYFVVAEHFDPFLSDRRRAAERISYAAALFTCNAMLAAYSVGNSEFTIALSGLIIAAEVGAVIAFGIVISLDLRDGTAPDSNRAQDELEDECEVGDVLPSDRSTQMIALRRRNLDNDPHAEAGPIPEGFEPVDDERGLFFSEELQLYLHRESCQYYDPVTRRWFDPAHQSWYVLRNDER